jgi:hypothetical protein
VVNDEAQDMSWGLARRKVLLDRRISMRRDRVDAVEVIANRRLDGERQHFGMQRYEPDERLCSAAVSYRIVSLRRISLSVSRGPSVMS